MSPAKPTIPKGTRDFQPEVMYKRNYILDTVKAVFEQCGFQPLETPAMENLDVLTGKYGDEGDQLLFRILNSGDYLRKLQPGDLNSGISGVTPKISEKGLRYDLTVPFARFVVMNQGQLSFPFRRYQIQPVWRGDRPQKGRYREFYQCDADVVGTDSLTCEAEIIWMIGTVMGNLGISDYHIKINHRKILSGLASLLEAPDENSFFVILDKLDKIGREKVIAEMESSGVPVDKLNLLNKVLDIRGDNSDILTSLEELMNGNEGIRDLHEVLRIASELAPSVSTVKVDPSLARGLSYYTGTIFEVKVNNVRIGSITGGGRYDDLTGVFGLKGMSGVGISFGVDRIYDVMEELDLFPHQVTRSTQVLITHFDQESMEYGIGVLRQLREAGIPAELYPDQAKLKKQLNYGNRKNIPHVIIIGSDEMESGNLTIKNMIRGEQRQEPLSAIIQKLKE